MPMLLLVMKTEWLKRSITVEETEPRHAVQGKRLGPHPVPFGLQYARWLELKSKMVYGDEFRMFRSPSQTWPKKCGRCGIALVRNGEIIDGMITMMD